MTIETIVVEYDGDTYYFNDGDLFWGHTIIVHIHDDGTRDAEVAG